MAGHSKWHNIQKHKGVVDAKRGKLFSQLSKNIRVAVKEGKSGDPKANIGLRFAIDKAREANMPNENIQRAIDRGLGKGKGGEIRENIYEAFGPGGVGMLIVAQTDNNQRTASELRTMLSKAGGSLGGPGSAMYLFERSGDEFSVAIPMEVNDADAQTQLTDLMDQLRSNEDVEDVYCAGVWPDQE